MVNGVVPERPEFEVTVSADDGVRVVAVSGELDIDTMVEFGAALTTGALGATKVICSAASSAVCVLSDRVGPIPSAGCLVSRPLGTS